MEWSWVFQESLDGTERPSKVKEDEMPSSWPLVKTGGNLGEVYVKYQPVSSFLD